MSRNVNRAIIEFAALIDEGLMPAIDEAFYDYVQSSAVVDDLAEDVLFDEEDYTPGLFRMKRFNHERDR